MTVEKKEVSLTVGDAVLPADQFTIQDKAYGERNFVRDGETYREVTKDPVVPVRTHSDRSYVMHDPASFISAVSKYGDKSKGIIFYNGAHGQDGTLVTMFFEEDSRKESIKLPLAWSLEFKSFLNGKEKAFDQKGFLKLLDTFPECVSSAVATLRPAVEKIELSTAIDFVSNLDTDNLTFIYQEKTGGNQTARLPKKLAIELPFYEGSSNKVTIIADLDVTMPKEEGAKPQFKLSNVKHERTERDALKSEIASLSAALAGWLFVNGK
jgi:hypothetical protein